MAIRNDAARFLARAPYWTAHAFIVLLGVASIAWGGFTLPLFWRQITLNYFADEYVEGHTFAMQSLLQEAQRVRAIEHSASCSPTALHDIVMLRLAILEEAATQDDQSLANSAVEPLYHASQDSLSCAPADPFVWLVLFWVDARKQGVQPANVKFLRLSYALGPNEGWIDLWRNRLAMRVFENLPDDLKADALDEFIKLVDAGPLYEQTVAIFMAARPATQTEIAAKLKASSAVSRRIFAAVLYDKGADVKMITTIAPDWQPPGKRNVDVKLPDVEMRGSRP